jgi:CelD/BcsL family acetyltransferase involved in cellulose biosynthesis
MMLDGDWSARVVRPRELSENEIELWSSLCRRDASLAHAFYSFAFARAVDRVHPHAFVAVLQHHGKVVAFLPFQFHGPLSFILRAAERLGGNLADRFGVIAGDDLGADPAQLLALARLNSLSYSFLPTDQLRHGLKSQRATTGQRVPLSGDPPEFWAGFRKAHSGFGTQIDRKERKCARELGPLDFTFQHAAPEQELQRIIAIKRDQYRRTNATDALASPWTKALFRELLCNPEPSCTAVVSTLYAGETWLASHLGLMSQDVFHYWFPVYNIERSQDSPGHILTKHMMLAALSRGVGTFDLGGFGEYKDRFRPESYELGAGFWQTQRIGGHLSHAIQSISWRINRLRRAR